MEHGLFFYLSSWGAAVVIASVALFLVTHVSFFQERFLRRESGRDCLIPRSYRFGGALLAVIFLILLVFDGRLEWGPSLLALWIGSLATIVFSVADDVRHVSWPWHLLFQSLLGILVFSSDMRLDIGAYVEGMEINTAFSFGLIGVVVWVVLIMNAINWADGTDGLMPGVAFLSFNTLFFLALRPEVNQPTIAILAAMLSGLALALLFFNWHPARILAGTGGAYFFGFSLAVLGLYAGMKVATLLLVLAIPVFDALFVVLRRLSLGRSPFRADQEHLHHLLLTRGWHPTMIAIAYLLVTCLMALLALFLEGGEKALVFLITGILLLLFSISLHLSLHPVRETRQ